MNKKFDHATIEKKWQKIWQENKTYQPDLKNAKKPFYNLMMFPYPSAEGLHVGNMYAFTGADVYGRFQRMQGHDVFEPIGLDGFGIHSENYALKIGKHPREQAKVSEENFYRQLHEIGNSFAWDNKLETYDPEYYKWTQWLFVQMFKNGLAYRGKAMVNWCPKDKTVLADEQVEAGVCERCKTPVERRPMEQWFFKITEYADRLLANIEKINWPDKIKIAQRQWIGKKEGAEVEFSLIMVPGQEDGKHIVKVFTTRLDTIFGVTFLTISPELANKWLSVGWQAPAEVKKYVEQALHKTSQERLAGAGDKTGVFTEVYAINPVNSKKVPVWVADYVLGDVGTGAVMGVPAHDERDFEFAKKYNLPTKPVIRPEFTQNDRDKAQEKLLREILQDANDHRKRVVVAGGWILDTHFGVRIRNHSDVDIYVPYEDVSYWKKYFESRKFEEKKLDPKADDRFYTEFKGENTWVDVVGFRINEAGLFCTKSYGEEDAGGTEQENIFRGKLFDRDVEYRSPNSKVKSIIWCRKHGKGNTPGKDVSKFDRDLELLGAKVSEEKGFLFQSEKYSDMSSEEAIKKIAADFKEIKITSNYHLRDWLISRQRYWGPPIPMVHCDKCGWKPVPEEQLPVTLPDLEDWQPKGDGRGPLENAPEDWLYTKCPKCDGRAKRETDVSDTFLDSSWYFLRYPSISRHSERSEESPANAGSRTSREILRSAQDDSYLPWDPEITKRWLPVNAYIGGAEHAVLHLLYARFVWMTLKDWGFIKDVESDEPFPFLFSHGMIIKDGAKMSKSRGNVVVPDTYIKQFGADTLRMYLMFLGPYNQGGDFRDTGIIGMRKFLERVWNLLTDNSKVTEKTTHTVEVKLHQTIKDMREGVGSFQYNTSIARFMELINILKQENETVSTQDAISMIKLIAPFAPHVTEELWQEFGQKESIHIQSWPEYDESLLVKDEVTVIVQVNGKVRASLLVDPQTANSKQQIVDKAKQDEKVKQYLEGKEIKKEIFVPGKLVNLVV